MRGRAVIAFVPVFVALTVAASASDRGASGGAVRVRDVQVREVQVRGEVRVDQPAKGSRQDQRPRTGVNRPTDPGVISRPPSQRQPVGSPQRQANRDDSWRRDRDGRRRAGGNRFYNFRPWFNTGYGIVVGYPVIYPYAYPYPYDPFSPAGMAGGAYVPGPNRNTYTTNSNVNTYSNVDSITTSGGVATTAPPQQLPVACEGAAPCGGLSFEISPATAQVWVDGVMTGVVDDFNAASTPLLLAPGDHYVELRLAGYRTASFDVTVAAGEVTPYQGTLEQLRLRTP